MTVFKLLGQILRPKEVHGVDVHNRYVANGKPTVSPAHMSVVCQPS